jgi:hypothetical protein
MAERKVLNKYYPPDFDARLLPRNKRPKDEQIKVRNMLPFTVQCATCGEYVYRGRKFNSRKELVQGEEYLGIKIWRFYIRCTRCNAEITFKTDPKNGSYVCELGAKQYFEKFHELYDDVLEQDQIDKEDEDAVDDPLSLLEQRQQESKREMEQLEALEELREITQRNGQLTYEELVQKREEQQQSKRKIQEIEDDILVQEAFAKKKMRTEPQPAQSSSSSSSKSLFSSTNLLGSSSSSKSSSKPKLVVKPIIILKKKEK